MLKEHLFSQYGGKMDAFLFYRKKVPPRICSIGAVPFLRLLFCELDAIGS